jgi:uncharacterized protein YjdB
MKKILMLFAIVLLAISCEKDDPVVTSISIPPTISINVGTSQKINVTHLPADLPAPKYSWETSDTAIFTVDNQGNINALKVGEATLTVKAVELNLSASSKIIILPITATSIEVKPNSTVLLIGDSIQLEGIILPENTTDKTIIWKSEDESVATVTKDGLVKAVGLGKAKISATTGDLFGTCEVAVNPILAEKVILSDDKISLFVGSSKVLTATVEPENTTNKAITWSSANEQIAEVSEEGVILAIGEGKTTITATCGTASASCEVTIEPVRVTGVKLSEENLKLEMTDMIQLSATVIPENATNKKVIWTSEDTNIATVDENGLVSGINEGGTRIVATTEDGNFTAFCDVVVTLKGLRLTKTHIKILEGEWELIHVLYSTNDNAYLNATWTSSNPNVATVRGAGPGTNSAVIEAKGLGTTTITATSSDGAKKASCTVEVVDITSFIDLSFLSFGIANINGFITGDLYSEIRNNSEYTIELVSFYLYDGYTGKIVGRQDPTQVKFLSPGQNTNLGTKLNSVYCPIYEWTIRWNGKNYTVQHQYRGSTRSTDMNMHNEKLNKITILDE